MANTNSARTCGDRGNACVLEGCVRLPAFHIVDPAYSKPYRICSRRITPAPSLRVVVFESANSEFYLHFDLTAE